MECYCSKLHCLTKHLAFIDLITNSLWGKVRESGDFDERRQRIEGDEDEEEGSNVGKEANEDHETLVWSFSRCKIAKDTKQQTSWGRDMIEN